MIATTDSGTRGDSDAYVGHRLSRVGDGWVNVGWCGRCGRTLRLGLMFDAKVAGAVRWTAKGAEAMVPNAFALPAGPPDIGGSCSGATEACVACYAGNLESAYPALRAMVEHNLETVRHLLGCDGWQALGAAFRALVGESVRRQAAAGIRRPVFRWHSDGDILGTDHARAIASAARATPHVEHWIYTRTLGAVRHLVGVPNLHVLVSADRFNLPRAVRVAARHALPIALLAEDHAERAALWARVRHLDHLGRIPSDIVCPAAGKWQGDGRGPAHIVGPDSRRATLQRNGDGSNGAAVGACVACRICLPSSPVGPRSVTFLVHGSARNVFGSLARVRGVSVSIGGRS